MFVEELGDFLKKRRRENNLKRILQHERDTVGVISSTSCSSGNFVEQGTSESSQGLRDGADLTTIDEFFHQNYRHVDSDVDLELSEGAAPWVIINGEKTNSLNVIVRGTGETMEFFFRPKHNIYPKVVDSRIIPIDITDSSSISISANSPVSIDLPAQEGSIVAINPESFFNKVLSDDVSDMDESLETDSSESVSTDPELYKNPYLNSIFN